MPNIQDKVEEQLKANCPAPMDSQKTHAASKDANVEIPDRLSKVGKPDALKILKQPSKADRSMPADGNSTPKPVQPIGREESSRIANVAKPKRTDGQERHSNAVDPTILDPKDAVKSVRRTNVERNTRLSKDVQAKDGKTRSSSSTKSPLEKSSASPSVHLTESKVSTPNGTLQFVRGIFTKSTTAESGVVQPKEQLAESSLEFYNLVLRNGLTLEQHRELAVPSLKDCKKFVFTLK
jgi:hypothetical protein